MTQRATRAPFLGAELRGAVAAGFTSQEALAARLAMTGP